LNNVLNRMNILCIVDCEDAKRDMDTKLSSQVKNIYFSLGGEDGLNYYLTMQNEIDTIICDMNNLTFEKNYELLSKIRYLNEELPFILNVEELEQSQLMKLIKFNISGCFTKISDTQKVLNRINICCHRYHQNEVIKNQKNELIKYISAVNNVAIISKTDLEGKITHVNDMFTKISLYAESELIGKSQNIVRHPENSKEIFSNMWSTIKRGDTWQGNLKNLDKYGIPYFTNSTIFPIFDDLGKMVVEYISIQFKITKEELQKRDFRKKVMLDRQELKKKKLEYITLINSMKLEIDSYKQIDISIYENRIVTLEAANITYKQQINHFESEMKVIKSTRDKLADLANQKIKKIMEEHKQLKIKYLATSKAAISFQEELKTKEQKIMELESRLSVQNKKIENLFEVITEQEKKIRFSKEPVQNLENVVKYSHK
jgi:PAS domain S-box-containing protein